MSDTIVDLTLDDDDEQPQAQPRSQQAQINGRQGGRMGAWDGDEVECLEDSGDAQRPGQQQRQRSLGDDEELAVEEERGEVWNKSFPHLRYQCGEEPFKKGRHPSNKSHCSKCFCFICDCLAGECEHWGDGLSYTDHCNAHSDSNFYNGLKTSRGKKQAKEACSPMPPPPSPPVQPQPCALVPIPDPELENNLVLLARIELRATAQRAHTFPSLREQLAPTGFYLPAAQQIMGAATRLSLDTLFESNWINSVEKFCPVYLALEQLPPRGEPPPDSGMRRRKVTIFHYDGAARPTTYGVDVPAVATVRDIMAAAAPLVGLDPAREQFLAADMSHNGFQWTRLPPEHKVTDSSARHAKLGLWRVPNPSDKDKKNAANYAVVTHRRRTLPGSEVGYEWEGLGTATVVPITRSLAEGGKAAERAVLERVLAALKPMRKEGAAAPPAGQAAKDLLGWGTCLYRGSAMSAYFSMPDPQALFATPRRPTDQLRYGETFFRDGKLFLRMDWVAGALDDYDLQAWREPLVHPSASPEAMQPTLDAMKAAEAWEAEKNLAKQLPATMVEELKAAAMAKQPGVVYPPYQRNAEPLARVVLDLVPDSDRSSEKEGRVVFKVYVWKDNTGPPHRLWFQPFDSWTTESGRNSHHHYGELGSNPLRNTMEVVLWGDPQHEAMHRTINEWKGKSRGSERSIPGLMKAVERGEMAAAPQPRGLTVAMRPYQLQSLQFMLDCEQGEGGFRRLFWQRVETPDGLCYWWSHLLGRASLDVPEQPWGGWCAEEMGLGKTIEVLALTLANPAPPLPAEGRARDGTVRTPDGLILSRGTLVVCAVSLVGQWVAEAQAKLGGSLRIHMYHGQSRIRDAARLATAFDLVVTTYATLSTEFGGRRGGGTQDCPLLKIKWHRLVLDEAHVTKNPAVGHSKACVALRADRRWLCTGTPINTDVGDLFGQFCVLGLAPFSLKPFFDTHVKHAYGPSSWGAGCPALLCALGQTMVRHTKLQVLGGEEVLRLPPKTEEAVAVVLTAAEQELYRKAHAASAALFQQYRVLGSAQINKHLLQIMALLLPMRRICSGGNLRRRDLEVSDPLFGEGANARRRRLAEGAAAGAAPAVDPSLVAPAEECAVCMDMLEQPSITPCGHWFCKGCILDVLAANPKCPLCRRPLATRDVRFGITAAEADALEAAAEAAAAAAQQAAEGKGKEPAEEEGGEAVAPAPPAEPTFLCESKLRALLKELRAMRRADPTAKALVFSQYVTTIDWLKERLTAAGLGYRYISGGMTPKQRAKAIHAFQADPPTTVFLLSMRSGSVGINLTAASHVFLMEPALNPALEEQAIGRAWRMGQKRAVTVKKFYVQGSVEERIMEVVRSRQQGGAGSSRADVDDEDAAMMGLTRGQRSNVRQQDLAGSIKTDRQNLRVGELEVLFQEPALGEPRPDDDGDEEEEEEEEAAEEEAELAAGSSRAHAALGRGRPRGRQPKARRAPSSDEEEAEDEDEDEESEEEEEEAVAVSRAARRLSGGRPTRRARRRVNYAELSKGLASDDEEEEEHGGGDGGAAAPRPAARRGKRRRFGEDDSEDEEFRLPEEEQEQEEDDDEDYASVASELEDAEEEESPLPHGRAAKRRRGRTAARRSGSSAGRRPMEVDGEERQQQQQQQQQSSQVEQKQQQAQPAARTSNIASISVVTHHGKAAPARPGSAGSGRLSTGEAAMAAPGAAEGAAGGLGVGATPQTGPRMPMRGRKTAALTAHVVGPDS